MSYDPNRFRRHNNFMDSQLHIGTNQTGGHKCSFVCYVLVISFISTKNIYDI